MPLSDDQLKRILDQEIESAIGPGGDLAADRAEAMDYFLGEATGALVAPDAEGRSKVVSSDTADVIHWILPQLIDAFTESSEVVRFSATSEEDVPAAEQESDYINYVFEENQGMLVYYTWFLDALLQRNGTVTTFWDETDKATTETYSGLTFAELGQLDQDPELEFIEHTERLDEDAIPDPFAEPVMLHDVTAKRTVTQGTAVVKPVPPESVLVNADHNSITLQDARFVARTEIKTASELVEMGFDQKQIDLLPSYDTDPDSDDRTTTTDEQHTDDSVDPAMRLIQVYMCYPLVDYNQDGIAERRAIIYVKGSEILENEEADCVPMSSISPFIQPHRHIGRSIFDLVKRVQEQKTYIWRSILDNFYLSNNQRVEVDINKVNLEDLSVNRPGGIVRSKQMGSVQPIPVMPLGAAGYQALEYMDKTREETTGVGPNMMGQNINVGGDTAHAVERMTSMKERLVAMIGKLFAETGVKDMFRQLHAVLVKNQDKEERTQLRGEWVQINPSEWGERTRLKMHIGGGEGERMKKRAALDHVLMAQEKLIGTNLLTEENIHNALSDYGKLSGLQDQGRYFTDPKTAQPKQPQPDPTQQALELQQQVEMQKAKVAELNLQLKQQADGADAQLAQRKQLADEQFRERELELRENELEMKYQKQIVDFELKIQEQIAPVMDMLRGMQ